MRIPESRKTYCMEYLFTWRTNCDSRQVHLLDPQSLDGRDRRALVPGVLHPRNEEAGQHKLCQDQGQPDALLQQVVPGVDVLEAVDGR